jgi:hypothetical protein
MKNLFKALANFQQEVPTIHKGTQGYGYSYANLSTIFEKINPILKKHKLGFTQLVDGQSIKTIIFHIDSGETLESNTDIPQDVTLKGMNDFQVLGSAITYIRRYALSSALGLITDKDIDAAGEQVKTAPKKQTLKSNTAEYKKVFEALRNGFKMEQVKSKYTVSKAVESQLIKELGNGNV